MAGSDADSDTRELEKKSAGKAKAGRKKAGKKGGATGATVGPAAVEAQTSRGTADTRNAFLRRIDAEFPHQVVLPRRQLTDDSEIMDFLIRYAGTYDMYVEDDYAAFVRYCFADPLDAEIFRARFEPKCERLRLAG
jgi:hypothetical protein